MIPELVVVLSDKGFFHSMIAVRADLSLVCFPVQPFQLELKVSSCSRQVARLSSAMSSHVELALVVSCLLET